jgi:hypothetical protein
MLSVVSSRRTVICLKRQKMNCSSATCSNQPLPHARADSRAVPVRHWHQRHSLILQNRVMLRVYYRRPCKPGEVSIGGVQYSPMLNRQCGKVGVADQSTLGLTLDDHLGEKDTRMACCWTSWLPLSQMWRKRLTAALKVLPARRISFSQQTSNIVIQGKRRPHIMMPNYLHPDVKRSG